MRVVRFAHTSLGAQMPRDAVGAHASIGRRWAWGDGAARGVRVCVVDSGVDPGHPLIGRLGGAYVLAETAKSWQVVPDGGGDQSGHGTACTGIIRRLAPGCEVTSLRVLQASNRGSGEALLTGLQWAIEQEFSVISVSLSTQRSVIKDALHDLADQAYFNGTTLVCSAHNQAVPSYPWRFSAVISVGSHEYTDGERIEVNPAPPVEFFGAGVQIRCAWPGGGTKIVSGNSFATPHVAAMCARILGEHPGFRTTQIRYTLAAISDNLGVDN
jgi:subtilisin